MGGEYPAWRLENDPPSWVNASPAQLDAIRASAASLESPSEKIQVWPVVRDGPKRMLALNVGEEMEDWRDDEPAINAIGRLLRRAHERESQIRKKQERERKNLGLE